MGNDRLSCNVVIHLEESEGKQVYVVECEELGVSDFGDTLQEAINNLRKGIKLLIEVEPEKAKLLQRDEPVMVTRVFI